MSCLRPRPLAAALLVLADVLGCGSRSPLDFDPSLHDVATAGDAASQSGAGGAIGGPRHDAGHTFGGASGKSESSDAETADSDARDAASDSTIEPVVPPSCAPPAPLCHGESCCTTLTVAGSEP